MLKENDFVELKYTGRIKNKEIFDTNVEEDAKKIGLDIKTRPLIICLGQNMILKAIDEFLIGKEVGKTYSLELKPEEAFGKRNRELVKIMPLAIFRKHNINPQQGIIFSFDGLLGKISAVSGGRTTVDFNNPLAGKELIYELKIIRKVEDKEEKIKALMLALFRREFPFEIKDKKLLIKTTAEEKKLIELFREKFKKILDFELEFKEKKEKEK